MSSETRDGRTRGSTSSVRVGGVGAVLEAEVQVRATGARTDVGRRASAEAAAVVVVRQQVGGVAERTAHRLAPHWHQYAHSRSSRLTYRRIGRYRKQEINDSLETRQS